MTILQVVQAIQRRLKVGEAKGLTETTGHWPVAELLDRINEGMDEVCRDTGCLYGTSLVSAVASTSEYAFDSDWETILGILWDNNPLDPKTIDEMDSSGEDKWRTLTVSGDPVVWGLSDQSGYFYVYKMPTADEADVMKVLHTIIPTHFTTASTDTDEPFNGFTHLRPYHSLLVWRTVADCLEEDATTEAEVRRVDVLRSRYNDGIKKLGSSVKYPKWAMPAFQFPGRPSSQTRPYWGSGSATGV